MNSECKYAVSHEFAFRVEENVTVETVIGRVVVVWWERGIIGYDGQLYFILGEGLEVVDREDVDNEVDAMGVV